MLSIFFHVPVGHLNVVWGVCVCVCVCVCDLVMSDSYSLMDYSLPGSSVQGVFQASILERVAIPFSRGSSQPRDQTCISCIGRWIFYH